MSEVQSFIDHGFDYHGFDLSLLLQHTSCRRCGIVARKASSPDGWLAIAVRTSHALAFLYPILHVGFVWIIALVDVLCT